MPGPPPIAVPLATTVSRRPALLTFFAVAAIAAGALKGFGSASSAAAPRLLEVQRSFFRNLGSGTHDNPVVRAQTETQQHIQEILDSHRTFTRAAAAGGLVVAAGLLLGGIGCLSLRRRARLLLIAAFGLGLGLDLAVARPTIQMQMEVANANAGMITRLMHQSGSSTGARTPEWVRTLSTTMGSIGIAMAISFMAAYAAFFVGGIIYLTRPNVVRLFQPPAGSAGTD